MNWSSDTNMLNLKGEIHECYPYFKRFTYCHNNQIFNWKSCALERNDYLECWNGFKRKQTLEYLSEEITSQKIISIPYYDPINEEYINEFDKDKLNDFIERLKKL